MTTVLSPTTRSFRCPVCDHAEVRIRARRWLFFRSQQIAPCPACGARYVSRAGGRIALAFCDPGRVAAVRETPESLACGRCVPCPVGRVQGEPEWEHVRRAIHGIPEQPFWPLVAATNTPIALEDGTD